MFKSFIWLKSNSNAQIFIFLFAELSIMTSHIHFLSKMSSASPYLHHGVSSFFLSLSLILFGLANFLS